MDEKRDSGILDDEREPIIEQNEEDEPAVIAGVGSSALGSVDIQPEVDTPENETQPERRS